METKTWNQQVVKRNNKALVLQLVMEKEPISRADIAQVSGLNKATVSSLVSELLEDDLVYESGPGKSSGGRRPVILHFNKIAGYSIGIDIGVNYILCVLTDLMGNIVLEKNQTVNNPPYDATLEFVKEMIHSCINEMPSSRYGIVGIGVGIPGIVNKQGIVLHATNLGWKDKQIKKDLENLYHVPIIIENEANAGAFGEQQFGIGQDHQNIIYISAGIGIGAGIILNKELYNGTNGFSGEIGHTIININGNKCNCGSRGCWEAYASEQALLERAGNSIDSLESLIKSAQSQNEGVLSSVEEIGTYLGYGINNIINIFNPDQVIIGNRLALLNKWIEHPIRTTIRNHTFTYHQKEVQLDFSKLGKYSVALGMAAFVGKCFIMK